MPIALALAVAIGLTPQREPAPPDTTAVHVRAVASDQWGRAVEDLGPQDFEVLEEGSPRLLDAVRFVTANRFGDSDEALPEIRSRVDEQTEAAREGTRLFAFFLDEYHVTSGAPAARVREALARFIEDDVGPRDLVVVLKPLDSLLSIRLTRDHRSAARMVAAFEGRKGEYDPRNPFEANFFAASPERVESVRGQIVVSALNALASHLGGLSSARKVIILVSEGFSSGQHRRGEELPTLNGIIRTAERAGASIYPIDPSALVEGAAGERTDQSDDSPAARDREMLRALAEGTGGVAILAANAFDSGLGRVINDSSGYYVLTFNSRVSRTDGAFRPIEVRVTRPGVEVKAATGYWAPMADDVHSTSLAARAVEPPPPPELPRRVSPLIRPWFGIARAADGRSRVRFVWETAPSVPGDRTRTLEPVRLRLKVSTTEGRPVFEGVVQHRGGVEGRTPTQDVSPSEAVADSRQAVFEVFPGRLRVVMEIEDETSRLVDTDVRNIAVGALDGPVAVATAEVLRARTAREFRALEVDPAAVPVASRAFSRSERLLIRVRAYSATMTPVVSAKLASELGGVMRDVPVAAGPAAGVYQLNLPLSGLAPGAYRVEVTAAAGRFDAKEVVAFRVTP